LVAEAKAGAEATGVIKAIFARTGDGALLDYAVQQQRRARGPTEKGQPARVRGERFSRFAIASTCDRKTDLHPSYVCTDASVQADRRT
jgi:hypothetical protein